MINCGNNGELEYCELCEGDCECLDADYEMLEDELVDAALALAERERELRAMANTMAQLHQERDELHNLYEQAKEARNRAIEARNRAIQRGAELKDERDELREEVEELAQGFVVKNARVEELRAAVVEALWGEGKAFDQLSDAVKAAIGQEDDVNIMEQRASEPIYPHHEHVMFWAHNPGTLPETREERIKRQFGHHMREMRRIHG